MHSAAGVIGYNNNNLEIYHNPSANLAQPSVSRNIIPTPEIPVIVTQCFQARLSSKFAGEQNKFHSTLDGGQQRDLDNVNCFLEFHLNRRHWRLETLTFDFDVVERDCDCNN